MKPTEYGGSMANARHPAVDAFLARAPRWTGEMARLREILLECGLEEALKWGKPCYMHDGANVAILQPFNAHCSLMFFKGVLLEDSAGLLVSPGPNSRSSMRIQFTGPGEIDRHEARVRDFVAQAVAAEREGVVVETGARGDLDHPVELQTRFRAEPALEAAFQALTPGRRREYLLHFTGAKRSSTRASRIERCAASILAGRGLRDQRPG